MRIVHVIDSLDPDQGGPSKVILCMASAQAAIGHEVRIIGTRFASRASTVRDAFSLVPNHEKANLVGLDRPEGAPTRLLSKQVERALEVGAPYDICHLHGLWDITVFRVARACRRLGLPYVIAPHGMLDDWCMTQGRLKKLAALRLTHGAMLRGAACIHALNAHEKRVIERFGFGVPVEVIPNGVFLDEVDIPTEPGEFRRSLPELGDHRFALFLSRLHYKKGLDFLADAWRLVAPRFPEVHLVVAGPREDDSIDDFQRRIRGAGLEKTVHVVGPVYGSRKVAAFRECECFVLPSRQEGFSISILEALALGAPCVISRECHFPEVGEAGAGIITELGAESVGEGISRMLGDDAFRAGAVENASRLVRERYVWPQVARRTIEVYEQVCGRPAAA